MNLVIALLSFGLLVVVQSVEMTRETNLFPILPVPLL